MPNPIKPIKGGIQAVQAKAMAIKTINKDIKTGGGVNQNDKAGPAPVKQSMTPAKAVKAFVSGVKNPDKAASRLQDVKAFKNMNGAPKQPGTPKPGMRKPGM
jgi:hypothetical protein